MNPMHLRRFGWFRRPVLLAVIFAIGLLVYWFLAPNFKPDEPVDAGLKDFIRSKFPLPNSRDAADRTGTVKRVHFMHKTLEILPDYRPFIASWRRVYPDYDLYFWTDSDIESFITKRYPQLMPFYRKQLTNPLERSDFARVLILHSYGGWYSDLDAGAHSSAENVTNSHSLIIPLEPYVHAMVGFKRRRLVNNAVMYSRAGHPFWMFLVYTIARAVADLPDSKRDKDTAVISTGPATVTRAMEQFVAANSYRCPAIGADSDSSQGFWCPFVPNPRRYLPLIDNSTNWLANWASIQCRLVVQEPEISRECQRLRRSGFTNAPLTGDTYTYHAFLHLTGDKALATRERVEKWGLDIRVAPMRYLE